jgi:hypothetical protein
MKITSAESILLTIPYRTSGGLRSIAGRLGRSVRSRCLPRD